MNLEQFRTSLQEDVAYFKERIDTLIPHVDVVICPEDDTAHLAGMHGPCGECQDCKALRRAETVSVLTDMDHAFCATCFPELELELDLYSNLWSLYRELTAVSDTSSASDFMADSDTDSDSDFTALSLLGNTYTFDRDAMWVMPVSMKECINTFVESVREKCLTQLNAQPTFTKYEGTSKYAVVDLTEVRVFMLLRPGTSTNLQRLSEAIKTVLKRKVNYYAGILVVSVDKDTQEVLNNTHHFSNTAYVSDILTEKVLHEVRIYQNDDMSFEDAVVCATALSA